jgi:RHS repeat-associated protein
MRETIFVWDPVNDCVISELDGSGAVQVIYTNEPQQYGGVISQRRSTTTSSYHYDALGSTRFLTDSSGNVTDTYLNDAWGNQVASTGTTVNPFKWVGKHGYYTDDSTAQVYVRARMYQPKVARWTSVDPLGFFDGTNITLLARNMPVLVFDPSGQLCQVADFEQYGPEKLQDVLNRNSRREICFQVRFSNRLSFAADCDCCRFRQYVLYYRIMVWIERNDKKVIIRDLEKFPKGSYREDCSDVGRCYGDSGNSSGNLWLDNDCTFLQQDEPGQCIPISGVTMPLSFEVRIKARLIAEFDQFVSDECCLRDQVWRRNVKIDSEWDLGLRELLFKAQRR